MRERPFRALFALATVLSLATAAACKTATLAPQGGECALATDCEPGLVCLTNKDGTRACGSDLSGVTKPVDPGQKDTGTDAPTADADTPDAPVVPENDGSTTQPDSAPPPKDAAPDTSTADASQDAGTG